MRLRASRENDRRRYRLTLDLSLDQLGALHELLFLGTEDAKGRKGNREADTNAYCELRDTLDDMLHSVRHPKRSRS